MLEKYYAIEEMYNLKLVISFARNSGAHFIHSCNLDEASWAVPIRIFIR